MKTIFRLMLNIFGKCSALDWLPLRISVCIKGFSDQYFPALRLDMGIFSENIDQTNS